MSWITQLLNDEQGAAMAEYALLVALISGGVIGALQVVGGSVTAVFTSASAEFEVLAAP